MHTRPPHPDPPARVDASAKFRPTCASPLVKAACYVYYRWRNVNMIITSTVIMDAIWFQQTLERAGASQADLARHLRLAPSAVSRMVKGERQMTQLETVQTAGFLGVSPEEVLRRAVDSTLAQPTGDAPRPGRG